ncbi:hypothetical protein [Sphingopyxis sp.]|uniref:hypothetical protein n=1 Tax=Sphingopyxis sp. TaxID=1908224 RepID=UPI002B465C18|nr:hypothetical protein [Sphingopyxis sp.]HJS12840.1 hypothetical protein [Sphingopyxis sp.]
MLGRNPLVIHADRDCLRGLQEAFGAVGEFFEVHTERPFLAQQDSVAIVQHKGALRDSHRGDEAVRTAPFPSRHAELVSASKACLFIQRSALLVHAKARRREGAKGAALAAERRFHRDIVAGCAVPENMGLSAQAIFFAPSRLRVK